MNASQIVIGSDYLCESTGFRARVTWVDEMYVEYTLEHGATTCTASARDFCERYEPTARRDPNMLVLRYGVAILVNEREHKKMAKLPTIRERVWRRAARMSARRGVIITESLMRRLTAVATARDPLESRRIYRGAGIPLQVKRSYSGGRVDRFIAP